MNREQRRAAAKNAKKDGNPELEEKVALFGKLEDECLTCEKPFDKKDKDMVLSWHVVVREEEATLLSLRSCYRYLLCLCLVVLNFSGMQ